MKIGWEPRNNNRLLPNALNHIIDLISSYLALSLTDLALLLGSTTKSFKFMALLSGGSGILLLSLAALEFLQRVSAAIKTHSNGIKLDIMQGPS